MNDAWQVIETITFYGYYNFDAELEGQPQELNEEQCLYLVNTNIVPSILVLAATGEIQLGFKTKYHQVWKILHKCFIYRTACMGCNLKRPT